MSNLVPHTLRLIDPGTTKHVYLALSPVGWVSEKEAFVFPSFEMAQRYAEYFIARTGRVWMPVATPERASPVRSTGQRCRGCGCVTEFSCPGACAWHEPDLCTACHGPAPLEMWAVYRSPADFPGKSVARRYYGQVPTAEVLVEDTTDALRLRRPAHLGVVPRAAADDPVIVETWM